MSLCTEQTEDLKISVSAPPKVTIGLPVFQGEMYLEQAIDSLLNQTYQDFVLVISDDASTDRTNEICEYYKRKNPQIIYSRNLVNLGSQGNLLKILKDAKSKYFVWASQDDYWDKDFLLLLVEKLEKNKGLSLAFSAIELIDSELTARKLSFRGKWNPNKLTQYGLISALLLPVSKFSWLKTNLSVHGVIRTEALKTAFNHLIGIANQDRIYILFLIFQGRWGYIDEKLYHRRTFTGYLLREKIIDPISKSQKSIITPLICGMKMMSGTTRFSGVPIKMKLYTFVIVILYCICSYWTKFIELLSNLIKTWGSESLFISVRTLYRNFKEFF